MTSRLSGFLAAIAVPALLLASHPATAAQAKKHDHSHAHDHNHKHEKTEVYKGYFEDDQIKARSLRDWNGDWQSVYPYLLEGTLDVVMEHKAEKGDKTAAEYKAYYTTGYKTDVDRIEIDGKTVAFVKDGQVTRGTYESDGYEVLTYKKGNRGVRFIFKKVKGDAEAPAFIQFSDHKIAPEKADHYHLYWGEDRAAILEELTNWPTYFPAALSAQDIVKEMLAH